MIRLDTNCLIRFFINDDKEKADLVENVIISNEVIAEIIYVLNGVYSIKKSEVVDILLKLLENPNIYVSDKEIIENELNIFKNKNLDFVDSLLCAYSIGDKILTFDKKLIKCIYANKGQLLVE